MVIYIASCGTRGHRTIYGESSGELLTIVKEEQDGPGGPGKHNVNCTMKFELLRGEPITLQYVPEQTIAAQIIEFDQISD